MIGVDNQISTKKEVPIEDLYRLKIGAIWKAFTADNFAFWMCCAYLFFEYVRPQAIWPIFYIYPYWARTFILLAFVGWVLDNKKQFVWTKITTGIFLLQLVIIISSMNAYWPEISWSKFMDYFNWVVVFFILTQTVTNRRRVYILFLIFLVASFKLSLYGARTFALRGFSYASWGVAGPEGYFQNPGELAVQMVVFAPIALYFTIGIKSYLKRWQMFVMYLMPITAVLTNIAANSRGAQLALAVQLVVMIGMAKQRFKTLLALAIVGYVGLQLLPPEQMARFEVAGDDATSIQRTLYWEHGWQMVKDHPVFGIGYFNFSQYYTTYHFDDIVLDMLERRGQAELPHNIFIQVGTDTGFVGLAIFIALMAFSIWRMFKLQKEAEAKGDPFFLNLSKGMSVAIIGYIVAGQFVTIAYYPYLWIHLVFVTAMDTCWQNEKNRFPM